MPFRDMCQFCCDENSDDQFECFFHSISSF
jgi:hypothetical protein